MMSSLHLALLRTLWTNVYTRRSVGVKFVSSFCMWMIFYLKPMVRSCYMRWNNFSLRTLIWRIWVMHFMSLALRDKETDFEVFWVCLKRPISKKFQRNLGWKILHQVWLPLWRVTCSIWTSARKWSWNGRNKKHSICFCNSNLDVCSSMHKA